MIGRVAEPRVAARAGLVAAVLLALAGLAPPAAAQSAAPDDPLEEYLRLLQIAGALRGPDSAARAPYSFMLRPLVNEEAWSGVPATGHPWQGRPGLAVAADSGATGGLRITPNGGRLRIFANTGHPFGWNDGVVWQGRGLSSALDVGATLRWRGLTLRFQPVVAVAQNASYDLAPVSVEGMPPVAYPWRRMDLPQRFGTESSWTLHPGQSEARLDVRGVTLGLSTRNLWWGPGTRNAILMSDNAPGMVHGFLGTRRPVDIGIGHLEASWIWGRLGQSDWFDPAVTQTDRFLTALVLTYQPSFLDGLALGFTRAFYGLVPPDGVPFGDYFLVVQGVRKSGLITPDAPEGNDEQDQILSLFARWALEESGFEVYTEWARNDHSWDLRDFAMEPEHSQGYTLGLQKVLSLNEEKLVALGLEITNLTRGRTTELRPNPVFYAHHIVTQGYTHEGQLLGAGVGPGGSSQYLGATLYAPWGRSGLFVERRVRDNDAYYTRALEEDLEFCCHDVSLSVGGDAMAFAGDFELGGGLTLTRELNRYFERGNDVWNLNLALSARWRPE